MEENPLSRLILELSAPDAEAAGEDIAPSEDLRSHLAGPLTKAVFDERSQRILGQSQRWISFLSGQAEQLTAMASWAYDQLLASDERHDEVLCEGGHHDKEAVIDRLEWTLRALDSWLEEQKPKEEGARLRIRWAGPEGDPLVCWVDDGGERSQPVSLRAVIEDGAEIEGRFPPELLTPIAMVILQGLRSGEIRFLRARLVSSGRQQDESKFEWLARGEAYKAAIATSKQLTSVLPPEVEAQLDQAALVQLASVLDEVSYSSALAEPSAQEERSSSLDLVRRAIQVAENSQLHRDDVMKSLLAVANHQLEKAVHAGDKAAALRLGRAVTGLAAFVLEERRK